MIQQDQQKDDHDDDDDDDDDDDSNKNTKHSSKVKVVVSGVFDGHGEDGHYVAEWVRSYIIEQLQKQLVIQKEQEQS